jgi:hypothetical protein
LRNIHCADSLVLDGLGKAQKMSGVDWCEGDKTATANQQASKVEKVYHVAVLPFPG